MSGTVVPSESLSSLAEKLRALDLTDDERGLLHQLIARAAALDSGDDVVGLVFRQSEVAQPLSRPAQRLALGLGMPILKFTGQSPCA